MMMFTQFPKVFVPDQLYNMFHNMDRELYGLLVMKLWRDPVESLQFIAFWLWLERVGFRNTVKKIISLPPALVNDLADEAFTCLNIIHNDRVSSTVIANDTPLMQTLIHDDLSLRFFAEHRLIATRGLTIILNQVCTRLLKDIMQHAIDRNAARSLAHHAQLQQRQQMMPQMQQQQVMPQLQQQQVQPMVQYGPADVGFPLTQINQVVPPGDRTVYVPCPQTNEVVPPGDQTMMVPWSWTQTNVVQPDDRTVVVPWNQINEVAVPPDNRTMIVPWTQTSEVVPAVDRTMFVTFSKGYPVHEWEVREFFTKLYGDCIESLHMQEVMPNEQPLFARIICNSASAIDVILNGTGKAKFNINGKHVWVRKFVPKSRQQ